MLKFIGLSGTTGVTENMYVYETENDMVVVDCGVGFPESAMFGVDLVIPDFDYIRKNRKKLRGIVITHGHEDHIGALPYLAREIDTKIYSTLLVSEFIKDKFEDHKIKNHNLHVFNPDRDTIELGSFKFTPFRISHSIPDGVGFAIDTPEGRIFHVADYKFDWTPVVGHPFDIGKAARLAESGVLLLVSDSLGSRSPGYTESEAKIESEIEEIVRGARGKVFFTTISSNISRIQQALNVASRTGRKVAFVGYSIDRKSQIAKKVGYLNYHKDLVLPSHALKRFPKEKVMYIVSGGYGQEGSALYRIAEGEHKMAKADKGDLVVFSSDPAPPGTKEDVDYLVDILIEKGLDVHYYDTPDELHVSGHGSQEDIKTLFGLTKPKYFIPVGGTIRHNQGYRKIAQSMGAAENQIFELSPGEVVEFSNGVAKRSGRVQAKTVLVDGLGIGDVGNVVLRDRETLSTDGIVVVYLRVDNGKLFGEPDIISRGFVYEKQNKGYLNTVAAKLKVKLEKEDLQNKTQVQKKTADYLEKLFYEKTKRRPMIITVL